MEVHLKLSKQSMQPLVNAVTYQNIIRRMRYLVNTYPDLAFAFGYMNLFLEESWEDHLVAGSGFPAMWQLLAIGSSGLAERRKIRRC
jgi:hypothetical protein